MDFDEYTLCAKYGASHCPIDYNLKVGISQSALDGLMPLNGVRYRAEGDTSGWYIWGGEEPTEDENFFLPMHLFHLCELMPYLTKYFALPPGWRFLIVPPDYEDVWKDDSIDD